MTDHEDDLRQLFREARNRDAAWTPGFERVLARTPRPRRRTGWVLAAAAAAAVVMVVAVRGRTRQPEPAFVFTAGDLRMPTDFLLDIAGAETLRSVPPIGRTDEWFPLDSDTKGHPL